MDWCRWQSKESSGELVAVLIEAVVVGAGFRAVEGSGRLKRGLG